MEKLTINHLLAYAPFGVMVTKDNWDNILRVVVDRYELDTYDISINVVLELEAKLILYPISDLLKEIECNVTSFTPIKILRQLIINRGENQNIADAILNRFLEGKIMFDQLPYFIVEKMLEWHFDVFGLIPKGLAYNINTLDNGEEDNSEQGEHNQTPDRKGTGNGWEIHDGHPR